MIPGIDEFYEGMNRHMAHEIDDLQDQQHGHEAPGEHHDSHHHDPTLAGHDSHGHLEHHPSEDSNSSNWGLSNLIPAALHGLADAAVHALTEGAAESLLGHHAPEVLHGHSQNHDPHSHHVGSTTGDGFTHQTTNFTCAVVSQKMILDQFHLLDPGTGQPISETRLAYDATVHGWLSDHGTSLPDLNKLLGHYGVDSHDGHDWKHLVHDLASGHQVVMAVNADRLWGEHSILSDLGNMLGNSPNHAIVVKGMKVDDSGHVVVVVNDPGQEHGAGVEYRLEHFQSSVDSTNLHYVATNDAPPEWRQAPELRALAMEDPIAFLQDQHGPESMGRIEPDGGLDEDQRETFFRNI